MGPIGRRGPESLHEVVAYRDYHPYMLPRYFGILFLVTGTLCWVECAVMVVMMPYKPADFESCNDGRTDLNDAKEKIEIKNLEGFRQRHSL